MGDRCVQIHLVSHHMEEGRGRGRQIWSTQFQDSQSYITRPLSVVGVEETTEGGWRDGSALKGQPLNNNKGKWITPILAGHFLELFEGKVTCTQNNGLNFAFYSHTHLIYCPKVIHVTEYRTSQFSQLMRYKQIKIMDGMSGLALILSNCLCSFNFSEI